MRGFLCASAHSGPEGTWAMRNGSELRGDLLCGDIAGARSWHRIEGVWDSPQRPKCLIHETASYRYPRRTGADRQKSPVAQMFAQCRQGAGLLEESVTNPRRYWLHVKLATSNRGSLERELSASSKYLKVETRRLPALSMFHCALGIRANGLRRLCARVWPEEGDAAA